VGPATARQAVQAAKSKNFAGHPALCHIGVGPAPLPHQVRVRKLAHTENGSEVAAIVQGVAVVDSHGRFGSRRRRHAWLVYTTPSLCSSHTPTHSHSLTLCTVAGRLPWRSGGGRFLGETDRASGERDRLGGLLSGGGDGGGRGDGDIAGGDLGFMEDMVMLFCLCASASHS